jgi:hypothetical protein
MPRPDPIPQQRNALMRRFWRIFALLALLSVVVAAIAVLFVTQGERTPVHVIIATALGAGLTVLLGTSLMTLVFLSAESGYDEPPQVEQESERE